MFLALTTKPKYHNLYLSFFPINVLLAMFKATAGRYSFAVQEVCLLDMPGLYSECHSISLKEISISFSTFIIQPPLFPSNTSPVNALLQLLQNKIRHKLNSLIWLLYLADPGEAKACSTNTVVIIYFINSLGNTFPPADFTEPCCMTSQSYGFQP